MISIMLSLNDIRWKDLSHRGWANGERYKLDPDAPFVPDELKLLIDNPKDISRFENLYPYLSSEGTTWEAAYAAAPYIVEIAKKLTPKERFIYLVVIGFFVISSCPDCGSGFEIKTYLVESYEKALRDTLPLLAETLLETHDASETRYLLAAIAALKGYANLGNIIENLDCYTDCSDCGSEQFKLEE